MHLSKSWYESLPFLYVVMGAISVMTVAQPSGVFFGWMLIVSGLLVFYMRLHSRTLISRLSSSHR